MLFVLDDVTGFVLAGVTPPSGNTGVQFTRPLPTPRVVLPRLRPTEGVGVSLGWLSCTWVNFWASLDEFTRWAAAFVGELLPSPRRWRGYESVWMGEHGVMVGARLRDALPDSAPPLELHLDIPATVLESLSPAALYALLEVVCQAQNITRADVTLDDWCKMQTPLGLELLTSGGADPYALNKDSLVTRATTSDYRRSKGLTGGDTWYLGSTSGDVRLRVYDKARESAGEVDSIRWELQLRGDRAKDAVLALFYESLHRGGAAALPEYMGEWAASNLVRFVDFRDRSDDSNISRCPRVGWWAALVLDAQKARPVVVKPPLTVQRLHDYAESALPSLLATLADSARLVAGVSAEGWLLGMLVDGRRRRSPRHRLALHAAGIGPADLHA